ncbi:MAG: TonB-dependent receptor, partial [Opitutaceae bacterium]|nr:TonB-dependent receptor [Opitutaceae bacterium]
WFKPSVTPVRSVRLVSAVGNSSNQEGWAILYGNDNPAQLALGVYSGTQGGSGANATATFNSAANAFSAAPGEWQFFAVAWSGTGGATWYAGTPASAPAAAGSTATTSTMGAHTGQILRLGGAAGANSFQGYMDDFRVYAETLTAAQIRAIYQEAGATVAPEPLPETPASWAGDTDARRAAVRPLYLGLLADAIAAGSNRTGAALDTAEAAHNAISHYTISHGYALALVASLYDPASLTPGQNATRDEYIRNARRIFLAVNAAVQNPAQRASQAGGLAFGLGADVRLYLLLRDSLGAFAPSEQAQAEAQLGDCAQAVLELNAEYGSFNRAACDAYGIAAVAATVPGDPRAAQWNAYADAIWNDWKHVNDTFEDARGYNGLWLHTTLCHAEVTGRLAALVSDGGATALFDRFAHAVSPGGAMPDYGGSSWTHALELWLPAFERLGHMYGRGDFLLNAQRLAGFIKRTHYTAGQISGLVEAVRLAGADSPASLAAAYQTAIATTRASDYGDTLFDKLYLRADDTHFAAVNLHDQGYHGRNDSGALGLYATGTHALLHTMGREATYANEQQGVVAAPSAAGLLDYAQQHAPGEWTRWLVHFRRPGTYAGGPVLDITRVNSVSFRLNAPGHTGTVSLEVESVIGVKPNGDEETIPGAAWSGAREFNNGAITSGGAFVGPGAFPSALDLSPYQYCYVKWRSNYPAAMQYFVFNGGALMAPAEPDGSSLRIKHSAVTLDAYASDADITAAKGGLTRLMLDSAGRKITHKRDLALRKSDGALLVLDTFEFAEAGNYTVAAAWHMQNLLSQGAGYVIARDDVQQGSGSTAIAEVPRAVRFDFAASGGAAPVIINGPDYTIGQPQNKHFAAALSGARAAGEKVSILTALRPDAAQSLPAPALMDVGENNGKPYANYVDAAGPVQIGEDPPPVSTMITGFAPGAILPGGAVTVSGVNFFGVTGVRIGGVDVPASGYSVDSLTSLTVGAVPSGIAAPSGYIQVIAGSGTATSPAQYTIATAPSGLAALPAALVVSQGRGFTLLASATGNPPPSFHWQVRLGPGEPWQNIEDAGLPGDATASMLRLANPGPSLDGAQFRYAAINSAGAIYSAPVTLTLEERRFNEPAGLVLDLDGNIYVADRGDHTIKHVTTGNNIIIHAGASGTAGNVTGHGAYARFSAPSDLVIGGDGALHVADTANSVLRRVTADGIATPFAGSTAGHADGSPTLAKFNKPAALAADTEGNFYIADTLNHVVRKVAPNGVTATLAGVSGSAGALDGPAGSALFRSPAGIAVSGAGESAVVYVADTGNHTVRAVASGGVVTLAGVSGSAGYADGAGLAALFDGPRGLAVDADGILYMADTGNSVIREINTATGEAGTVAGTPTLAGRVDGGPLAALFDHPEDAALDNHGNLYIADTGNSAIRKIDLADNVTSVSIAGASPLPPPPEPNPGNTGGAPDNKNHGGGAPSAWFLGALAALGLARFLARRPPVVECGGFPPLLTGRFIGPPAARRLSGRERSGRKTTLIPPPGGATSRAVESGDKSPHSKNTPRPRHFHIFPALAVAFLFSVFQPFAPSAFSQQPATGGIRGRVLNPGTGDYVWQARVRVVSVDGAAVPGARSLEAFTDEEGNYWLGSVPAGEAKLETFYTGQPVVSALVQVVPGQTAQAPVIEIGGSSPAPGGAKTDGIVKLDTFVVTSSREMSGAALAVNSQRFADNTRSVVSIDEMGFTGDGNLAGALKFLPGVDLADDGTGFGNYITLSGAPSANVPVTVGGFDAITTSDLAQNTDSGNGNQRSVNLMQISTAGISRIEINRSPTPDSPGKALAGSVNFVPKSAFERVRPVYTFQLFGMANQETITLDRKTGPLTSKSRPVKDGESFSAIVPISKRFGVSLGFSRSTTPKSISQVNRTVTANWNNTTGDWMPTPNNPDHYMLISQALSDFNNTLERFSANLTADFKLSRTDTISFAYNQGHTEMLQGLRQASWLISQRAGAIDRDNSSLSTVQTVVSPNTQTNILNQTQYISRQNRNLQLSTRYRHRGRVWDAELGASHGKASGTKLDLDKGFSFAGRLLQRSTYIKFEDIQPWSVGKITGSYNGIPLSPLDAQSYVNAGLTSIPEVRFKPEWTNDRKNQLNGFLSRRFAALDSIVKIGFDYQDFERKQHLDDDLGTNNSGFVYNGTDAALMDFVNHNYNRELPGGVGVLQSLDLHKLTAFYLAHRDEFTQVNPANDRDSSIRNDKSLNETISSAYIRMDSSLFRGRLQLVYGVRYEYTKNEGIGPANLGGWVRKAASANHSYDHLFPSVNANFTLLQNLVLRASYSQNIGRPDYYNIIPAAPNIPNTNAINPVITLTNPGLSPWTSDNVSLSVELYSSSMGDITLRGYRRWVKDAFVLKNMPASESAQILADFGIDPLDYSSDLQVRAPVTIPGTIVTSGLELSGRYQLDEFLPRWARGITVKFSASRSTVTGGGEQSSAFAAQGLQLVPWSFGGGVSFHRGRFSASVVGKWNDTQRLQYYDPTTDSLGTYAPGTFRYLKASFRMDLDLGFKLTKNFSLFINGRDINGYTQTYQIYGPHTPDVLKGQVKQEFDPVWTLGLTAKF